MCRGCCGVADTCCTANEHHKDLKNCPVDQGPYMVTMVADLGNRCEGDSWETAAAHRMN